MRAQFSEIQTTNPLGDAHEFERKARRWPRIGIDCRHVFDRIRKSRDPDHGAEPGPESRFRGDLGDRRVLLDAVGVHSEGFDYFIDSNPADAQTGNRSFAGGGIGAPGFISQSIATLPGQNYTIDLWLANLSGFADGTEIQVMWGGNVVYDATDILGFGYNHIIIDPLATSTNTMLSIGLRDDSFFLNIDNVSVRRSPPNRPRLPCCLAVWVLRVWRGGAARRPEEPRKRKPADRPAALQPCRLFARSDTQSPYCSRGKGISLFGQLFPPARG